MTAPLCALAFLAGGWVVLCAPSAPPVKAPAVLADPAPMHVALPRVAPATEARAPGSGGSASAHGGRGGGGWVVLCALAALAKCALQLLRRVTVGF